MTIPAIPVYIAIDTSASLAGTIHEVNQALAAFVDYLTSEPRVGSKVELSVISFSDHATLQQDMEPASAIRAPTLSSGGATAFGPVFRLLRELIPGDVIRLQSRGRQVYRPIVYFITDGMPNDRDWQTALDDLQADTFRERPTIVAFGFGTADPITLSIVAGERGRAFLVSQAIDPGEAARSAVEVLRQSLASSVQSSTSGQPGLAIPLGEEWIDVTGGWDNDA